MLYRWIGDKEEVRHLLKPGKDSDIGFEDAKLMLVAASVFVNYLKEKAIKACVSAEA